MSTFHRGVIDSVEMTRYSRYTDEELIEELRELSRILGRVPTKRDLDGRNVPAYSTYTVRFKSWANALRAAFTEPEVNARLRGLADDEKMRQDMIDLTIALDRPPTAREMTAHPGAYHANTYIRHYGSWARAVKAIVPPF